MTARRRCRPIWRTSRHAAGVGLVTAIFLLVVLAGLGVAIVSVVTGQQSSAALDQQGARAYQAARAGIEWAMWSHLRSGTPLPCQLAGTAATSFAMPPQASSLAAFTVTISCNTPVAGHFLLTATACNQPLNSVCPNTSPGPDYVQRQLQAEL
ncbi:pilus assembly PilX N-terminal domain-containing protein [Oxalobacteraceae bacterium]|nr:pilus assembly PilX N-terminal domain-containing protein [Oxalobacteraceae bacterium]